MTPKLHTIHFLSISSKPPPQLIFFNSLHKEGRLSREGGLAALNACNYIRLHILKWPPGGPREGSPLTPPPNLLWARSNTGNSLHHSLGVLLSLSLSPSRCRSPSLRNKTCWNVTGLRRWRKSPQKNLQSIRVGTKQVLSRVRNKKWAKRVILWHLFITL